MAWSPAEKLEENLLPLLMYSTKLGLTQPQVLWICHVLSHIKARRSLTVSMEVFGISGDVVFDCIKARDSGDDSYSMFSANLDRA